MVVGVGVGMWCVSDGRSVGDCMCAVVGMSGMWAVAGGRL